MDATLPDGFVSLNDAWSSADYVNTVGIVVDYLEPFKSRGSGKAIRELRYGSNILTYVLDPCLPPPSPPITV